MPYTAYKNRTAHLRDTRLFVECKSENLGSSDIAESKRSAPYISGLMNFFLYTLYALIHILCLKFNNCTYELNLWITEPST